jgi:uncharacterized membrane protein YeiH
MIVSILAGLTAFFWYTSIHKLRNRVQILDAAGLGIFAVAGAQKALVFGLNPLAATMLGMTTGIGGGILRDIFLARVPVVLSSELYAIAAMAGAGIVVLGYILGVDESATAILGALICFGIRFLAIRRKWKLPTVTDPGIPSSN